MKVLNNNELQRIELNILLFIDNVCKEEGIDYSLAYGTLLGAVRHKGFIPWDDDVDIFMTRDNFEKFARAISAYEGRYKLCWLTNTPNYTLPLPKVIDTETVLTQFDQRERMHLGVYVDVFIFDYLPDNAKKRTKFINKMNSLQRKWTYSQCNCPSDGGGLRLFARKIVYFLYHLINPRYFSKRINKCAMKYRNFPSSYIGSMTYYGAKSRFIARTIWLSNKTLLEFEGHQFFACSGYKDFLTSKYGDYMRLPPVEARKSQHSFVAFFKTDVCSK